MVIRDENAPPPPMESAPNSDLSQLPLASPTDRLAAFVIDHAIVLPPLIGLATAPIEAQVKDAFLLGQDYKAAILFFLALFLGLFLVFFYHWFCNLKLSATLGQKLLRLRVVDFTDHSQQDMYSAFLRSSSFVLNLIFFGLGSFSVCQHRNRRTFYDRISETVVLTKPSKAVGQPSLQELIATRTLMGSLAMFAVLAVLASAYLGLSVPLDRQALLQSLEEAGELCTKVTESTDQWPMESGEQPSRLSIAVALLLAGEIDVSCLKAELNPRILLLNEDKLYYLAKSMVHAADNPDLTESYLQASCDSDATSAHCQMATAMQMIVEKDWSWIPQLKQDLKEDAPVFFKIWLVDQLVELEKFEQAQAIVDELPNVETLAAEKALLQLRIFAGRKKIPEAKGAFVIAKPLLADHENGELLGRICHTELQKGCDAAFEETCADFTDWVATAEESLSEQTSLAYADVSRCSNTDENLPESRNFAFLDKNVQNLVRARLSEDTQVLNDLTEDPDVSTQIRLAAMSELVQRDPTPQNLLRAELMSAKSQPGSEKLADVLLGYWTGERQFEKIVDFLAKKQAVWGELKTEDLQQLVVSEYHLGRAGVARKYLGMILEKEPQSSEESSQARMPASFDGQRRFADEFELISKDLQ